MTDLRAPVDADVRLISHATTLGKGVALAWKSLEKARLTWVQADWRRLKAVEEGATPNRVFFLEATARAARKDYDSAQEYYNERLTGAADYIRTEVRGADAKG
jgi:hypothetical protein